MFSDEFLNGALREFVADDLQDKAKAVAETLRGKIPEDVPVKVSNGVGRNNRPYSMVTIAHASGLPRQAKRGVLTRSAAENGLDVRRYPAR